MYEKGNFYIRENGEIIAGFKNKEHAETFLYVLNGMKETECPNCKVIMKPLVLVHLNCKECKEDYTR